MLFWPEERDFIGNQHGRTIMFLQQIFHSFLLFLVNAPIDLQLKLMIQYESAAFEHGRRLLVDLKDGGVAEEVGR